MGGGEAGEKRAGFVCEAQWVDGEWPFAENLWIAASPPPANA